MTRTASWALAALVLSAAACGDDNAVGPVSIVDETVPDAAAPPVSPAPDAAPVAGDPNHIPITRAGCTPFGSPPRPVEPFFDTIFGPTCLGQGGSMLPEWADPDGTPRKACLFEPAIASTEHPLPLVIFLHPSVAGTDLSLLVANVREQLSTANLSGDPSRPGFIMLAPYGRVTDRYYPIPDQGLTPGWDNWYRQLKPGAPARTIDGVAYPENVDAASIDHYLALVVAQGKVDPTRIFIMGWSNGAAMATLYALNRPEIAALAVYSSPDPFQAFNDPCPQAPIAAAPADDTQLQLFRPNLPMYQIHNDCDIAGLCPNSDYLAQSLADGKVGTMQMQMIDTLEGSTTNCLDICGTDPTITYNGVIDLGAYLENLPGYSLGTANHFRWPFFWTGTMFDFLSGHPLGG